MGDKARELGGWWDRLVAIDGAYGEIKEWSFRIRLKISLARKKTDHKGFTIILMVFVARPEKNRE